MTSKKEIEKVYRCAFCRMLIHKHDKSHMVKLIMGGKESVYCSAGCVVSQLRFEGYD